MICLSIIGIQAKAIAGVITLADLNLTDAMSITGQTANPSGVTVAETYAESTLIPYNSLVPIQPDAEGPCNRNARPYLLRQSRHFQRVCLERDRCDDVSDHQLDTLRLEGLPL